MKKQKPKPKSRPTAYSYIRYSTPSQAAGHSFERQMESSREYALDHGLVLDESLTFEDLGVSGYHGKNLEKELGNFIKAVEVGQIKPGSYLLVESLDRLSRQNVNTAFPQFNSILAKGITVVTLIDERVYTKELELEDMIYILVIQQRANEESKTKGERVKDSWHRKRVAVKNGNHRKLTTRCPAWLRWNESKQTFVTIPEREAVVRKMFKMSLDEGLGNFSITKRLNSDKVPTFTNSSTHWHQSYVNTVLTNPAVIGRFQPHNSKEIDGSRVREPQGDPIENYYPQIIDEVTFYKVQETKRAGIIPAGRAGSQFSNLFSKLAYCQHCGGLIYYDNKGKSGSYLICSTARKGGDCQRYSWRYLEIQYHILTNLRQELDFHKVVPELYQKAQDKRKQLLEDLTVKEGELEDCLKMADNAAGLLIRMPDDEIIEKQYKDLKVNKEGLEKAVSQLQLALNNVDRVPKDLENTESALRQYIDIERSGDQKKILVTRGRLYGQLTKIIDTITLQRADDNPKLHGSIVIKFKGVKDYHRLIEVSADQKSSHGIKVKGHIHQLQRGVVNAQWPPPSADSFVKPVPVSHDWFWPDGVDEHPDPDFNADDIDWDA